MNFLKKLSSKVEKKVDSARALITQEWKISLVSRTLCVSRAQLYVLAKRKSDWKDKRGRRTQDDSDALARIHNVIDKLSTYGYRRVRAMLRRQSENENIAIINAKGVYRIMKQSALLLERKPTIPVSKRAHTGKVAVNESNQR